FIAASASSLSRAVRAPYPSSWRIPATSSRMSLSSSTMRMSGPMVVLPLACDFTDFRHGFFGLRGHVCGGEAQPGPCAPSDEHSFRQVVEFDASAVLFQDAADDREPEAGAFLARRYVGLEQPVAIVLREPDAVVEDIDDDVAAVARHFHLDAAAVEFGR